MKPLYIALSTLVAATPLGACTSNGNYVASPHQRHRAVAMDLDTAARVEARIQADERQALRHTVRVNVVKGQAELLGEARNAEERQMAETVALQTHGVKEVKNLMTLRR